MLAVAQERDVTGLGHLEEVLEEPTKSWPELIEGAKELASRGERFKIVQWLLDNGHAAAAHSIFTNEHRS